ncbi:glutathione-regulated potassium-efflux system protein KefC [soil metagenome]
MSSPADHSGLFEAAIYLASAVIAVPLFKKLGLGSVLGYLIAGIVIGPHALALVDDPQRVLDFAEFGVVLLLFLIGLDLEPERVWSLRKPIFGLGGSQVVLTIALVFGIAWAFGVPWRVGLVAGIGFAMSSTAIGLALLEERRERATPGGEASFAVLLFQDLAVVPLILLIQVLAPSGEDEPFRWMVIVKAVAVLAAVVLASRTVVRPLMRIAAQTQLREIFFSFAVLLVIGVALAVQSVGLSMALGAFLAGVLLADSEYRLELQSVVEPLKGLLLGLFFIAVGMLVDVPIVLAKPWLVIGLAIGLVAGKAVLLFVLARIFRTSVPSARLFALALSQAGEFAFVLFNLAVGQGTLDQPTFALLNTVVAISMLTTPLLLVLHDKLLDRRLEPVGKFDEIDQQRPVVIAGFGRFGQMVSRVMEARGIPTTMIDRDPNQVETMRTFGYRCYYGDAADLDLLEQAGLGNARLFVIAIDDPELAIKTARAVRKRWPALPLLARARSRTDAYEFFDLKVPHVRETLHSALELATMALRTLGETPHAAWRITRHFERHDASIFERAAAVRADRQAVIGLAEQSRRDLQAVLSNDRYRRQDDRPLREDGWSHLNPPES